MCPTMTEWVGDRDRFGDQRGLGEPEVTEDEEKV